MRRNYRFGNNLLVITAISIWGVMTLSFFAFLWFLSDFSITLERFYLLPWCLLAGIVTLAPSCYYFYRGELDFFHPLVFGVWTYIFPAFVLGGVILAFGWSEPYYLTLIENPAYNLPLSLIYVMIGYIGLTIGYALPLGKLLAEKMGSWMPRWDWNPSEVWVPGLILLVFGIGFNIVGFLQGLIGFQRVDEIGIFDGLLFFLVTLLTEGTLLLWLGIFSVKHKTGMYYIILLILIMMIPLKMALQGSRGSLFSSMLTIAVAFQYSGRRLRFNHTVILSIVLLSALFVGVIYGTAFRNIKGSESRAVAGDYIGQISATLEYLSAEDIDEIIYGGATSLAERVDNLSALGVAVANYEKLAPYEASFGIENNIIKDLYTSLIPRFIWANKPPTSDARAYSELYFDFSDNSFAVTPFGDLLRNFGPFGVPLGMMLIGIYFRLIYTLLIKTDHPAVWKKVAYFVLLTLVSYESFYATIFPSFIRTVIILGLSLIFANIIVKQVRVSARK